MNEVEWPVLTNSHHRCGERTWPKRSHKRKTKFVRFHEDPCDLVNDEAENLNSLGFHDCSDINHIDNAKGWIRVTAIMGSGAAESVAPLDVAKNVPLKDSEGSHRGQVYHGAAGDKIANRRKTYQSCDGEWRCLQRDVSDSCRDQAIEFYQQNL